LPAFDNNSGAWRLPERESISPTGKSEPPA